MVEQEVAPASGIPSIEDSVIRPCAYCQGTGQVELGVFVSYCEPCPVCEEGKEVRVPEDHTRCRKFEGTGKDYMGQYVDWFVPCEVCRGTGWSPPPHVYN